MALRHYSDQELKGLVTVPDAAQAGAFSWERAVTLGDIIVGAGAGRTSEREITLFKSVGSALEDVAVAAAAYEKLSKGKPLGLA